MVNQECKLMPGGIVSVRLVNFMTYSDFTYCPNEGLNLIAGCNGAGKSSIVCALFLGLGGKPENLGRCNNIRGYIKHGEEEASVTTELYKPDSDNLIIQRNIDKSGSKWLLAGARSTLEEVHTVVRKLKIDIDNPCQFLPQEKVLNFVKMNQKQLLENTEKTIGSKSMWAYHSELIELQGKIKSNEEQRQKATSDTSNLAVDIRRLEDKMLANKNKEDLRKAIEHMETKKSWLHYTNKSQELLEIKAKVNQLEEELRKEKKNRTPVERQIVELRQKVQKTVNDIKKAEAETDMMNRTIERSSGDPGRIKARVEELEKELEKKYKEDELREKRLNELKNILRALTVEWEKSKEEAKLHAVKEKEVNQRMSEVNQEISGLESKERLLSREMDDSRKKVGALMNVLKNNDNVDTRKLECLANMKGGKDAKEAVLWLRENKHMFRGEAYEPIMMMVNLTDTSVAKYLEQKIPIRDLVAFCFEYVDDSHKFIQEIRNKRQLKVNVIHTARLSYPNSPVMSDKLRNLGLERYLTEFFTAPEPVMSYLVNQYKLWQIPIGSQRAFDNMDQICETEVREFFAGENFIQKFKSQYDTTIYKEIKEVSSARCLNYSRNQVVIEETQKRLRKEKANLETLEKNHRKLSGKMAEFREQWNSLGKERTKHAAARKQPADMERKLKKNNETVRQLQEEKIDIEREKKKTAEAIKAFILKEIEEKVIYTEACEKIVRLERQEMVLSALKRKFEAMIKTWESRLRELEKDSEKKEQEVQREKEKKLAAKVENRRLYAIVAKIPGCENGRLSDRLKNRFGRYADDIAELETSIAVENERYNMLTGATNAEVAEFQRLAQQKVDLEAQVETLEETTNEHKARIESVKNKWLPMIDRVVGKISDNFMQLLKYLGCAGEVRLNKGNGNEDDYQNYGVSIRVRFRKLEEMSELTSHHHSGGEKVVTTMLYIIALQNQTLVPFRIVDEINQGMDEKNEQQIFDILNYTVSVERKSSSNERRSQYFVFTPKLFTGIKLDKNINVEFVMNGLM